MNEYLVGYGVGGEFGRFRATRPLTYERGQRVVVHTHRGLESGRVLRDAAPGHAAFLPNTTVGQLIRAFGTDDEQTEAVLRNRGNEVLGRAVRLTQEIGLPLEVLDAEMLLDGEHVILHHLRWEECDVRPFVSTLAREFGLHILLTDLTRDGDATLHEEEHADHGCGHCGSDGGCGSCSSGGCDSCGKATGHEVAAVLREQTERQRMPLL